MKISQFLERILMEHKDINYSLDSKLQIVSICSIRIRSRKLDMVEKPEQLIFNPSVLNDASYLAGKPLISGAALRWDGQVTVYLPDQGRARYF